MIDVQKLHDSAKVYIGSLFTMAGSAWTWMGENYQSIGAVIGIIAFVYTTVVFVQGQIDRQRRK